MLTAYLMCVTVVAQLQYDSGKTETKYGYPKECVLVSRNTVETAMGYALDQETTVSVPNPYGGSK